MTDRPARLTFPSYDVGMADILWEGKSVGFCLAEFRNWRAYLYPAVQESRMPRPRECEEVTGRTLGELREELRKRAELKGWWWWA